MNRIRITLLLTSVIAALQLVTGCASAPKQPMPQPGHDWSTQTGQLQYRPHAGKSVIGDTVVRRSGSNDFLLIYTSGPGVPLLRLQVHGTSVTAEGLFARGRWNGEISRAPAHLRGWLKLPAAFAAIRAGSVNSQGAGWSATTQFSGGAAQRILVRSTETGDEFVFHFSR